MKLEIWFEFASTYSYLTVSRAEKLLADAVVELVWRPFLLGPIFRDRGMNTSPFVLDPVKGRYMWRDMERRCETYGLPFIRPNDFPVNGLTAARIMTAALDQPWCGTFARAVFAAQFGRGADISDDQVLVAALETCGVTGEPWLERAQCPDIKDALRASTDHARRLGIFGAPSMVVGDELFWGDDRFEDAIAFACDARREEQRHAQHGTSNSRCLRSTEMTEGKPKSGPILRLFQVRTKSGCATELIRKFGVTSAKVVRGHPGNQGYFFGHGVDGDENYVTFTSVWRDLDAVKARFGDTWQESFLPPGYEDLIEECSIRHIDVGAGWHVDIGKET